MYLLTKNTKLSWLSQALKCLSQDAKLSTVHPSLDDSLVLKDFCWSCHQVLFLISPMVHLHRTYGLLRWSYWTTHLSSIYFNSSYRMIILLLMERKQITELSWQRKPNLLFKYCDHCRSWHLLRKRANLNLISKSIIAKHLIRKVLKKYITWCSWNLFQTY